MEVEAFGRTPKVLSLGSYRILQADHTLSFPEPNLAKMRFTQTSTIRIEEKLRFFERRFSWSGGGMVGSPRVTASKDGTPIRSARRHGPIYDSNGWQAFLVDMGDDFSTGTEVTISTEMTLVDEAGSFKPFLSMSNRSIIETAKLRTRFFSAPELVVFSRSAEAGEEATQTLWNAELVRDDEGFWVAELDLPNEDVGEYRISWGPRLEGRK